LRSIAELSARTFWQNLAARLESADSGQRHGVIFIHGYNVSFRDAAIRAAQLGFDLSIKGAMAFFSWPSKGRVLGYAADEASIEASENHIAKFLADFATKSGADRVHIIAHSMGNRGVLRAVNRIAAIAQDRTNVPFDQIVLAAADVDTDTFYNLASAYPQVCRRTTMYVSRGDRAVEASRWLHKFSRVGLTPPICIVPSIDTINVTNVDLTRLGHGYVGEARDVLHDMHALIVHGTPPNNRFGLKETLSEKGKRYWTIGA
jgi:esterase/lipase superfamily enzyme